MKFPTASIFPPEVIDRELKRMIKFSERPMHYDLIRVIDTLKDFNDLGIYFTQITLGQALQRIGAWRTPRMKLRMLGTDYSTPDAFSVLWAVRDIPDYKRMSIEWLRDHYYARDTRLGRGAPIPRLGRRFDPYAPQA